MLRKPILGSATGSRPTVQLYQALEEENSRQLGNFSTKNSCYSPSKFSSYCVNWYRNFWELCSRILSPLAGLDKLPKKAPLLWSDECQQASLQITTVMAEEVLFYYPDPNKPFFIARARCLQPTTWRCHLASRCIMVSVNLCWLSFLANWRRYPASGKEAP
mmetsp:Transcript_54024/g.80608  ORF Transcript_54024/g.80608 Transcript_54024/m.80608 type:complete len:161 (-) Transcript_54024:1004-1486(-)